MEISTLEKIYEGKGAKRAALIREPITAADVERRLAEVVEIITGPPVDPAERLRALCLDLDNVCAPRGM
jgi:hypothetical protein